MLSFVNFSLLLYSSVIKVYAFFSWGILFLGIDWLFNSTYVGAIFLMINFSPSSTLLCSRCMPVRIEAFFS